MNLNDLYLKAVQADKTAEELLYSRLSASFEVIVQHRIWYEEDREEIVQNALMTVFDKYREVEFEISFAAWAHSVLKNKILDYIKAKRLHSAKMEKYISQGNHPTSVRPNPELKVRIKKCFGQIHKMFPKHARILNLHYLGFTTGEICVKLDISRSNYYTLLSRARKMLETCLYGGDSWS